MAKENINNNEGGQSVRNKLNAMFAELYGLIASFFDTKADKSNVLQLDNIEEYEPASDYNPSTKKYVDDVASNIVTVYDATVGVGGNYQTHKLAYAAGARRVAQISDVTETADSNVSGSYFIEGNGYTLTSNFNFHDRGNPSKYFVARNLTIKVSSYVSSFFYTYDRIEIDNCILDHSEVTAVSFWNNAGLYPRVRLESVTFKPSAKGTLFNYSTGSIKNCIVYGIATGINYKLFRGSSFVNGFCVIDNLSLYGTFKSELTEFDVFEDAGKTEFRNCRHLGTGFVTVTSPKTVLHCINLTINGTSSIIESGTQNELKQDINIALGKTYKVNNVPIALGKLESYDASYEKGLRPIDPTVKELRVFNNAEGLTQLYLKNTNDASNYAGAVISLEGSGAEYTNYAALGKYNNAFYIVSWRGNAVLSSDKRLILASEKSLLIQVGGGGAYPPIDRFSISEITGKLTALTSNYEAQVTAPNDIPNKKYVDDKLIKIISAYDATVGVGGDYLTHKLAFASGARKVLQISNVTETSDVGIQFGDYEIDTPLGENYYWTCDYRICTAVGYPSALTLTNILLTSASSYSNELPMVFLGLLTLNNSSISLTNAVSKVFFTSNNTGVRVEWRSGQLVIPSNGVNFKLSDSSKFNAVNFFTNSTTTADFQVLDCDHSRVHFTRCRVSGIFPTYNSGFAHIRNSEYATVDTFKGSVSSELIFSALLSVTDSKFVNINAIGSLSYSSMRIESCTECKIYLNTPLSALTLESCSNMTITTHVNMTVDTISINDSKYVYLESDAIHSLSVGRHFASTNSVLGGSLLSHATGNLRGKLFFDGVVVEGTTFILNTYNSDSKLHNINVNYYQNIVVSASGCVFSSCTNNVGLQINSSAANTKIINCKFGSIINNSTTTQILNADTVQNEFTNSINIPTGKTYKINNVPIFDLINDRFAYDATVGVGGDYATHKLSWEAGMRNVLQISDVTEIGDISIGYGTYSITGKQKYRWRTNYRLYADDYYSGHYYLTNIYFETARDNTLTNQFSGTLYADKCTLDFAVSTYATAHKIGLRINILTNSKIIIPRYGLANFSVTTAFLISAVSLYCQRYGYYNIDLPIIDFANNVGSVDGLYSDLKLVEGNPNIVTNFSNCAKVLFKNCGGSNTYKLGYSGGSFDNCTNVVVNNPKYLKNQIDQAQIHITPGYGFPVIEDSKALVYLYTLTTVANTAAFVNWKNSELYVYFPTANALTTAQYITIDNCNVFCNVGTQPHSIRNWAAKHSFLSGLGAETLSINDCFFENIRLSLFLDSGNTVISSQLGLHIITVIGSKNVISGVKSSEAVVGLTLRATATDNLISGCILNRAPVDNNPTGNNLITNNLIY